MNALDLKAALRPKTSNNTVLELEIGPPDLGKFHLGSLVI